VTAQEEGHERPSVPSFALAASGRPRAEPQPGGRAAAPGDLRLLQAFVNSRWNLTRDLEDEFASPASLAGWLTDRGLLEPGTRLTRAELADALDVREGLRALLFANNGTAPDRDAVRRLNRALRVTGVFVQLEPQAAPRFAAVRPSFDSAMALIGMIAALAQLDDRWARLKACPGDHCGWAFYDYSRNQAGRWCAMSVCGSRTKARHYRRRKKRS
jgi:predicted RNA-binding Zn ribbon-like protein